MSFIVVKLVFIWKSRFDYLLIYFRLIAYIFSDFYSFQFQGINSCQYFQNTAICVALKCVLIEDRRDSFSLKCFMFPLALTTTKRNWTVETWRDLRTISCEGKKSNKKSRELGSREMTAFPCSWRTAELRNWLMTKVKMYLLT